MENAPLVGTGASASFLLGRKLDSIPFSIYHLPIILVLGVVGFVEGYDLALGGSLLVLEGARGNSRPYREHFFIPCRLIAGQSRLSSRSALLLNTSLEATWQLNRRESPVECSRNGGRLDPIRLAQNKLRLPPSYRTMWPRVQVPLARDHR
jgi:hypothetical protein